MDHVTMVDVFHFLDRHMETIVLIVMFVLGKMGWSQYVMDARAQMEELQKRKDVQLATEFAYAMVERHRRQTGNPDDPRAMALSIAQKFFTDLGKTPPPDLQTLAGAIWDSMHERDVKTGVKPGTGAPAVMTVPTPASKTGTGQPPVEPSGSSC